MRRRETAASQSASPAPPSIGLVAELVRFEREMQEQRWDAADAKAGTVLGFGGLIAALVVALAEPWYILATIPSGIAVWHAMRTLKAADFERQSPELSYYEWSGLPIPNAQWQAYADETRTLLLNEPRYEWKVRQLIAAWNWLAASVLLLVGGAILHAATLLLVELTANA